MFHARIVSSWYEVGLNVETHNPQRLLMQQKIFARNDPTRELNRIGV
jgi:hypothetical protein